MEVHALHIKITMIRCLPNLLDDFTALRGSWGGTVSADVSILARKWRLFHPWTASFLGQAAALRFRSLSLSAKIIPETCPEIRYEDLSPKHVIYSKIFHPFTK